MSGHEDPQTEAPAEDNPADLAALRQRIDELDEELIALLGRRFRVTREVGRLKAERGLAAMDAKREAEIEAKARRLALEHGLSDDLVVEVLRSVIDRVVAEHRDQAAALG